jgi:hypothetical protein
VAGIADSTQIESKEPEFARNQAIHKFLHNMDFRHFTHIFFLDDDSTPVLDDAIVRLHRHNKPFVAGVTPILRYREGIDFSKVELIKRGIFLNEKKAMDLHWNAIIKKDGQMQNIGIDELPRGLFRAHRIGGTGLLVRRDVLEKLKSPYQKTTYNEKNTGVTLSEDIYFSEKVREAGFDLWVDPAIECEHWHIRSIREIFMIAMQAKKEGYEQAKAEFKVVV